MVSPPTPTPATDTNNGRFREVPRRERIEIGDTGVTIFSGILYSRDYNTEWSVPARYGIIDQMRNDPTIAAALRAVKLPLMRARHYVEPASDSALHREQAEWLEHQLFNYMYGTFADFQRHALLSLDYGSYPHEIVLHVKDGRSRPQPEGPRICIQKLAPRHPASIYEWHLTPASELAFIRQVLKSDKTPVNAGVPGTAMTTRLPVGALGQSIVGSGMQVDIPADKLLLFINEQEGADFTGRSILRPVYKPYWYKQGMEAVDAVAKEKRSQGIDVMELEDTATEDDKNKAEAALMTLRAHQNNFLTIPKSRMAYDIKGIGAGSVLSTMETMEFHDLRILRAFFTEFLAMGPSGSGGLTQHEDKTKFLLMLVEAIGEGWLTVVNRDLIPRLIQYNWGPQDDYPKLCHGKIDVRDLGALADGLFKLSQAGFLMPRADRKDEEYIRSMYDMPEPGEPMAAPEVSSPAAPPGSPSSNRPSDGNENENGRTSDEPPDYLSHVVQRQLESMRVLARKATDVNDVVALSVPFKAEAARVIAERRGWSEPEQLIRARTLAEVYAGSLKARVVREWVAR